MRTTSPLLRFSGLALLTSALLLGACSDDTQQNNATVKCQAGEVENPITGQCVPQRKNPNPRPDIGLPDMNGDSTSDDMGDMDVFDLPPEDMPPTMVDLPTDTRCAPAIDSDGDGLTNSCECRLGTDPGNSDTDGDTLPDGFEDANKDCMFGTNETQATSADTDSDGLSDGVERRNNLNPLASDTDGDGIPDGVEFNSCLNPKNKDTDGDGIPDGEEDINKDGKIGICTPNPRQYEPVCAQGEYDPCKADTDGDGTPDSEEVNFLGCRQEFLNNLPTPTLIKNTAANYQLALNNEVKTATTSGIGNGQADVFNHEQASYAGFIASLPKVGGATSTEALRDALLTRINSAYPGAAFDNSGRRTFTHDNHPGLVGVKINLGRQGKPNDERDRVLNTIAQSTATHNAGGTFSQSVGNLSLLFSLIDRGGPNYIITGVVVSDALHQQRTSRTGYLVDDAISAASVATANKMLETACVSYRVDDKAKVDFIWIIDGSGSMSDENAKVRNYATDFTNILTASNLDWRLGVVSSNCSNVGQDMELPANIKQIYGSRCDIPNLPIPVPIPMGRYKNGMLCDKNGAFFTNDPQKFKDCVDEIARQSATTEHTATIAPAAVARALPRVDNDPKKLRRNAATVIISVTDEFDDLIEDEMGWPDAGSGNNPPNDPSTQGVDYNKLDGVIQPFVDYLLGPDARATLFGLFWVPMQMCNSASEAAVGIQRIVDRTGGASGNICSGMLSRTLQQIAEASAGLASGLRVQGSPVAPTITVRIGDVSTQMIELPMRSRAQGWDYDAVTNAVVFNGNNPPQTNDRVVITYQRWEGSLKVCMSNGDCANGLQKMQCVDGVCL